MDLPRNPTRAVRIGTVTIGDSNRIAVQSMCATKTENVEATVTQVKALEKAGADVVRIAVDSKREAEALIQIRERTSANLSVDLQENYRLALAVAPYVDKLRYNPGHLYHHEREKPWQDKVRFLADVAEKNDCAIRVGVNCGSVDPAKAEKYDSDDSISPMLESALVPSWPPAAFSSSRARSAPRQKSPPAGWSGSPGPNHPRTTSSTSLSPRPDMFTTMRAPSPRCSRP